MINPFVSQYVEVVHLSKNEYKVVAKQDIPENTVIEVCPVLPITKRAAIFLVKSTPSLKNRIIVDDSVISREVQLLAELEELDLDKKLDDGKITGEEYSRILRSHIDPNSILDSKSHGLLLGNGLLYRLSNAPNLTCEYFPKEGICVVKSVYKITKGVELTYFAQ